MIPFLKSFTTLGFVGRLPGAPGTYGSLVTLPVAFLWAGLVGEHHLYTVALILVLIVLGTLASTSVAKSMGVEDPSEIIIDEVVGQWIAVLAIPHHWAYWLAAFVLFRIFDIWKPGIIDRAQHLPGGLGIMMDDVLAGIFAFLLIQGTAALL
jgi:phosphatidylglycerophosphatase A